MGWEAPVRAQKPRRVLLAKPLPAEMSEATPNEQAPIYLSYELGSVQDGTSTFAHSDEMASLSMVQYSLHVAK